MPPKRKKLKRTTSVAAKKSFPVFDSEPSTCSSASPGAATADGASSLTSEEIPTTAKQRASPKKKAKASKSKAKAHQAVLKGKLDINKCTISALKKAGVPLATARKVIKYRKKHKCFVHINELMRIQGVRGEMFGLLTRVTTVGSKADEINDLLKRRRPVVSRSPVKAQASKSKMAAVKSLSKTATKSIKSKPPPSRSCYSDTSISDNAKLRMRSSRWPRGSASLSSVLTISPKAARSRLFYDKHNKSDADDQLGRGLLTYEETIPRYKPPVQDVSEDKSLRRKSVDRTSKREIASTSPEQTTPAEERDMVVCVIL